MIPTLALGLPSGPMTALLLGALIIQGLVPGPEMLTEKASITLSMVFYLCLANIAGALICILATPALARVATVPAAAVVAVALCFVTWGAYQTQASAGDLVTLLCLGLIGWVMRAQNWSRPAFALGFILGPILEHYVLLSWQIHGTEMLLRPSLVMVFFGANFVGGLENGAGDGLGSGSTPPKCAPARHNQSDSHDCDGPCHSICAGRFGRVRPDLGSGPAAWRSDPAAGGRWRATDRIPWSVVDGAQTRDRARVPGSQTMAGHGTFLRGRRSALRRGCI